MDVLCGIVGVICNFVFVVELFCGFVTVAEKHPKHRGGLFVGGKY
jgi:hypothetical protein